ncbi:MAG TPA: MATE family efflux transporter [Lachnospiraceae bacterium]|nr:MATE family efflux transporter [Lachnospiraceae bacterium]
MLWKMSVPSILGVLAYNLYNIVDTIFISKGAGIDAIGGVAVSFPLFLLLSAVSSTLGNGAASVISRALGNKDPEKAEKAAANTFALFYLIAILITVTGLLFLKPLLYSMGVTEELMPYAQRYTRIILFGAVTSTGFSSLIRAEGNSRYAMYIWVIPLSVNILLDPIFIFGFRMGVTGAAAATVAAQIISAGMSIYYFYLSKKSSLRLKPEHFIPDKELLREIILIGIPSFLQMTGYSFSIILVNQILKKYGGNLYISTYGIVSKINTFLLIPVMGLVQGLQPVIGYNKGADRPDRIKEALKKASAAAGGYGLAAYGVIMLFSSQLLQIFTSDSVVIGRGAVILQIVNIGIVCTALQYIQSVYFQAIGKKLLSLLVVLSNQVICFIPALLFLSGRYGLTGVWYAFPVSSVLALLISTVVLFRTFRE